MAKPGRRFVNGHNKGNLGRKHTILAKEKMSKSLKGRIPHNKGQGAKYRILPVITRCWCNCGQWAGTNKKYLPGHNARTKIFTSQYRMNLSLSAKEKRKTDKHKEATSVGVCNAYLDGRIKSHGNNKNGYFYSTKNQKNLYYRSSYELQAFQLLEKDDNVTYYEYEKIRIPYIDANGKFKNTIPDIIAYCGQICKIIEIKPIWKLQNDPATLIKISAIHNYCSNNDCQFAIWTEKELFDDAK